MHSRLAFLCLSLVLCAFAQDGAPAVGSYAPEQNLHPALPNHVKLVPGFAQYFKPAAIRPPAPASRPVAAAVTRCGHITVFRVSREVDPNIIWRLPGQSEGNMPVYKGLPACPEDVR